jgi:hypothetical protein
MLQRSVDYPFIKKLYLYNQRYTKYIKFANYDDFFLSIQKKTFLEKISSDE